MTQSVQFSRSVVSNSLWPHELQHAKLPCPSPTPGAYPNSCPLSRWCHPTIPSSVILFSSCPPSFPASGSFPMSQLFAWGGQSIGVSASTSVLPMNTQDWSPLGWTKFMIFQENTSCHETNAISSAISLKTGCHSHRGLQPPQMVSWWVLKELRKKRKPAT